MADGRSSEAEFDAVISRAALYPVFQPVVDLSTGDTVGYEALIRGPSGTAFATPERLFRQGAKAGRLAELDWICRAAVCRAAIASCLPPHIPLFVNTEPAALRTPAPAQLAETFQAAARQLQVVVEISARSLAEDPAGLLAAISGVRESGLRVVLEDVGDDSALAMLPLLSPDVIKFDRAIVQDRTTPTVSAVVNAVLAEAERTGATVVAEGIESEQHLATARSMGATLGQGWFFGRPEPLPDELPAQGPELSRVPVGEAVRTPYEAAAAQRPVHRADRDTLYHLSRHLENQFPRLTEPPVLLAAFQQADRFDQPTRDRYAPLAERSALTAVFARDLADSLGDDISGIPLTDDDPLTREWTVIMLGAHFAGGLFATERDEGSYDYVLTYDRRLVVEAAQPLLRRMLPARPQTFW
ncbi:sensor domain-containing phosphodiesterase [Catellatospora tritici]|uniref:sensor domain-containing phosphodiesterase n=1 Tax=Catellatospora tritici TaxID=2851566 RepID=UPI001C2DB5AE|nr:EAL domain-containing protein [Catellatospora tritici]MBV1853648.1 EAL domain-containing protein [Catellatospora tritici]